MYPADLLNRRNDQFVLWIPQSNPSTEPNIPYLIIGTVASKSSDFSQITRAPLIQSQVDLGLWSLNPNDISPSLADGIYYYWFEVQDTSPEKRGLMRVTDPLAYTIDYSVSHPDDRQEQLQPASVIKFRDGRLWPCDIDGNEAPKPIIPSPATLPSNNHLVIYELPTSWAKSGTDERGVDVDIGTFQDVLALFDKSTPGARFSSLSAVRNNAILADLGINALELLPAADAKTKDEWGYATAHYFAPDYDLGSSSSLVQLINKIHTQNIRFFTDVVMAFGHDPYTHIAFAPFHLRPTMEPTNPDSYQSHANGVLRDGYGGTPWRYIQTTQSYSPSTGESAVPVHPSWTFHHLHLTRWMTDFAVDSLRLDSVNNIANWDFVRSYKSLAWDLYNARHPSPDPSKFLVIGEELSMPASMLSQDILNSLWNEPWQGRLRAAILGESVGSDDFEWTIRKLVDCTLDSFDENTARFTDGSQAINYITSHDIEGYRKERLYNFLTNNGIHQEQDIERRAKLAFALLLTSVGIPMIFAGEEFADQMDRSVDMGKKQTDPVNYGRKDDGGWRERLFSYVAGLVRLRKQCPALGENETEFIHVDGRVLAWRRGAVGEGRFPVVVVVNFGGEDTRGEEYVVEGEWPDRERCGWREATQGRMVPVEWVGREPLMRWEAKVYTRWVGEGEG